MSTDTTAELPVITSVEGRAGFIVLNRPRAINALTHEMVTLIQQALDGWRDDPEVTTVVLTGAGERGLCAGGDIVSIYNDAKSDTPAASTGSAAFWHDEYILNATIADYPKPYVAVMDGIVLGGGVGISAHGSHRIVTEKSSIGMPETGIGFVPDVGGTWLLSHTPGELGTHLALTAGSVRAGDAVALGLADHYVVTDRLPQLLESLRTADPDIAIAEVATEPPPAPLEAEQSWIDSAYAGDDVDHILSNLRSSSAEGAGKAADLMETRSPTSLAVALRALRSARTMPGLASALEQEYRMVLRFLDSPDFVEGIRAAVIDKDRNPAWHPATAAAVSPAAVEAFFEPLPAGMELDLGRATDQHTVISESEKK